MSVKLLSNLDFAAKLNSVEAVTESGKEFLKNYRGYMYQNASSCGIVNGFIQESQNYPGRLCPAVRSDGSRLEPGAGQPDLIHGSF